MPVQNWLMWMGSTPGGRIPGRKSGPLRPVQAVCTVLGMIRGYQARAPEAPTRGSQGFRPAAALGAGLLAGAILLVVPRGSPWSSLTFFTPAIMGRALPPGTAIPLPAIWALHLALSVFYGFIVSVFVSRLVQPQAEFVGGLAGFGLFLVNWGVVSVCWPRWLGGVVPVLFTHVVFGLIAAGAYRGLARRRIVAETSRQGEPTRRSPEQSSGG